MYGIMDIQAGAWKAGQPMLLAPPGRAKELHASTTSRSNDTCTEHGKMRARRDVIPYTRRACVKAWTYTPSQGLKDASRTRASQGAACQEGRQAAGTAPGRGGPVPGANWHWLHSCPRSAGRAGGSCSVACPTQEASSGTVDMNSHRSKVASTGRQSFR